MMVGVPVRAVDVALFINTTYVDYIANDSGSEASNLQATLTLLGHNVTTFTGITDTDINAAVAGKQALAIPELENGDLDPDLNSAARAAIASFVNNGGTLLMFDPDSGDPLDVLNDTFGFSLSVGNLDEPISLNPMAIGGTAFVGGPRTLPDLSATDSVSLASLPSGALAMYTESGGDSVVTVIPYGSGKVIIMGWDWFNARPVGSMDGGWLSVLNSALGIRPPMVTPAPALSSFAVTITAGILLAMGLWSLRRRAGFVA